MAHCFAHIFRNSETASGMETDTDRTSATACAASTPWRPKSRGRTRISGMKKIPLRAEAVTEAFTPFPIDWSIMFVMTMVASSGSAAACYLSAAVPTLITSGSSRKKPMIRGANAKQNTAMTVRKAVPQRTQKKNPSLTLSFFSAP